MEKITKITKVDVVKEAQWGKPTGRNERARPKPTGSISRSIATSPVSTMSYTAIPDPTTPFSWFRASAP